MVNLRLLKFRAWDADKKEMYTPKILQFIAEDTPYIKKGFWATHPITGIMTQDVMQCVGIFGDAEVFEEDVVEYDTFDAVLIAHVQFKKSDDDDVFLGGFALKYIGERDYKENESVIGMKVLGNTYQHPELLESAK